MIKYKVTSGEVTKELECQTIGELIEYLDYDNEVAAEAGFMVNIPDGIPMYDSKECVWKQAVEEATSYDWDDTPSVSDDIPMYDPKKNSWYPSRFSIKIDRGPHWPKIQPFFIRPDGSTHQPKTETINGEEWFINDGQQPVGDDVRVDIKYKNNTVNKKLYGNRSNYDKDYAGPYKVTHWRLAK